MRRLRYAVIAAAMAGSGVYVFVYLYRWEWHRALVAAALFIAAEIGLATAAVLDRLGAIDRKLSGQASSVPGEQSLARIQEAAPEPADRFDWLTRPGDGLSVFVPLLLGAGVVLSAVAWLVERVARATAGPALERGLAQRLAPLSLPAGTLQGRASVPSPRRRRSPFVHVAAAVAAAAVATVGVDQLADATQDRPDPLRPGSDTSVVLAVSSRPARPAVEAAHALWGACTMQVGRRHRVVAITDLGGGRVDMLVRPAVGEHAERRLRGCLGDGTTDKLSARVVEVRSFERL